MATKTQPAANVVAIEGGYVAGVVVQRGNVFAVDDAVVRADPRRFVRADATSAEISAAVQALRDAKAEANRLHRAKAKPKVRPEPQGSSFLPMWFRRERNDPAA